MSNPSPNDAELAQLHAQIMQALRAVADPEIGESIVDLGLVETLSLDPAQRLVALVLVPTSATCPMADQLINDAGCAIEPLCPPPWRIEVEMDWDKTWTPDRLAPALRQRFGW